VTEINFWNDGEPCELIAVWESLDAVPAPGCFDDYTEPVPAGQHPIEGQLCHNDFVTAVRIWIPTPDAAGRRPIQISVGQLQREFDGKRNSPVKLLPDLEFYDEWSEEFGSTYGIRRIHLGRRIVERLAREDRYQRPQEGDGEDDGD
jgi:hypothetical protein